MKKQAEENKAKVLAKDYIYHGIDEAKENAQLFIKEVINASRSIFGNMPVSVVVAGGKPPIDMPIILGLVE